MSANPARREAWLSFYLSELQRGFNIQTPEIVHITCGWSSKGQKASKKGWTVELIHKDYSKSGAYEFFISPECTAAEEFKDQLTYYLVVGATRSPIPLQPRGLPPNQHSPNRIGSRPSRQTFVLGRAWPKAGPSPKVSPSSARPK